MSEFEKLLEYVKEQTLKWGEFTVHDTDPPSFTATLTEDKRKLHVIRKMIKGLDDGDSVFVENIREAIKW